MSLWADRQKLPDPDHPIPEGPPQPGDEFRPSARHVPRAVTIIFLVLMIAAVLFVLGAVTRIIVL
ncbi:MAG TPA: hypothetical protein VIG30_16185 [Ktedonobacterales bacterium]|jgi:hypothetical protein